MQKGDVCTYTSNCLAGLKCCSMKGVLGHEVFGRTCQADCRAQEEMKLTSLFNGNETNEKANDSTSIGSSEEKGT